MEIAQIILTGDVEKAAILAHGIKQLLWNYDQWDDILQHMYSELLVKADKEVPWQQIGFQDQAVEEYVKGYLTGTAVEMVVIGYATLGIGKIGTAVKGVIKASRFGSVAIAGIERISKFKNTFRSYIFRYIRIKPNIKVIDNILDYIGSKGADIQRKFDDLLIHHKEIIEDIWEYLDSIENFQVDKLKFVETTYSKLGDLIAFLGNHASKKSIIGFQNLMKSVARESEYIMDEFYGTFISNYCKNNVKTVVDMSELFGGTNKYRFSL